MTVESVTNISDLNATYPAAGDDLAEGDNHIRNLKTGIKTSFPNISGPMTRTHTQLNAMALAATTGLTLYVRTDGSDSNTGLADTAGGAFLTIQKAMNVAASYDNRNYAMTVKVADGTYAESVVGCIAGVAQMNEVGVYLTGNTATPANVIVSGLELRHTVSVVNGFSITASAVAIVGGEAEIKNCRLLRVSSFYGADVELTTGVTLLGSTTSALISNAATINVNNAVTVSGTPAYSTGFAQVVRAGNIQFGAQPSGSATGPRYAALQNGVIITPTAAADYLPGDSVGTTASGGQYV